MAFERLFKQYSSSGSETGFIDNSRVIHAECELLRQGGCGSGTIVLHDPFRTANILPGQHIQFMYDLATPWYLGRVEEIDSSSPNRTTVRLYGWHSCMADIPVGGRGPGDPHKPIHYKNTADEDLFPSDPDEMEQQKELVGSITDVLQHIADNYVIPNSPVTFSDIDAPLDVNDNVFQAMVFRGEESCSQIFRQLAVSLGWSSWGIDENGILFVKNLPISTTVTFQEAQHVMNLRESVDRSLMFNRLTLTGGPIYGSGDDAGFYHYRKNVIHYPSREAFGEKKIAITLPWLRTNKDVEQFCKKFMQEYAGLTTRYTFSTLGLPTLGVTRPIRPWTDRVGLLDRDGNVLKNAVPVSIQYSFDETPKITSIVLGPEDLQFPKDVHPTRHEEFDPKDLGDGFGVNCQGFTYPLGPIGGFPSWECSGGGNEGVLKTALAGPTCLTDAPASATVTVYKRDKDTHQLEATTEEKMVYSSDPHLTGVVGAYCRWKKIAGVDQFTYLACDDGLADCPV